MATSKTALIAGATGLVGSYCLDLLLNDNYYERVIVITRRSTGKTHRKMKEVLVDFNHLENYSNELVADHIFCCLGTTIKTAGSKEKFVSVDKNYPVSLAKVCRATGATEFLVISAMGADRHSWIFYNKVKGAMQEEILKIGYPSVHIVQPSLIMGERSEKRNGEKMAQVFFENMGFLFRGPFKKYAGIEAKTIAAAMVYYAKEGTKGTHIHTSDQLQQVWDDFYAK